MRRVRTPTALILAALLWGCSGIEGVRFDPVGRNREGTQRTLSACSGPKAGPGSHASVCQLRREPEFSDAVAR